MRLEGLLQGQQQYVVPYFQRAYSWRRRQWDTLFDDILELYELGAKHSHFLGSMVVLAEGSENGVKTHLLIDGQQRLVTLSLFLAAIRDAAREPEPALADRVHASYLVNPERSGEAHLKVMPTYQDRSAFASVVIGESEPEPSPIKEAFDTFRAALKDKVPEDFDLNRLIEIVTTQLSFVAITLDSEDNPFRIFESLNAKGMPLTQGDLLRNYFFMRLPPSEHERWYNTVWTPMQRRLGASLDDFMRDYLMKEGEAIRPDEVYQGWRKRLAPLGDDEVRAVLQDLADWSVEYDGVLHPQRQSDPELRKRLERLNAWSKTLQHPFNPFLLRLHADLTRGKVPPEKLRELPQGVESFLVRRMFVSAPDVEENLLFFDLYNQASQQDDRAEAFLEALSRPQIGWPTDDDFVEGIVQYPLFFASHPDQRKLVIEAVEDSYPHRFAVRYQVLETQLITPLLPTADWLAELGLREEGYWKVIGALGNFTWTPKGRVPNLGVAARKKDLLRMTRNGLGLVKDFAEVERWTAEEIERRSRRLADRALEIWPGPRR